MIAAVAAVIFGVLARRALADPQSEAQAHFDRGRRLFASGDAVGARAAFEASYRILPNHRVLANVAACFAAEERPVDAVRTFRRFLEQAGDLVSGEARAQVDAELTRLREHVGDITLVVEPSGANVLVDGSEVGDAPLRWPVAVEPGAHVVEVRAEGRRPFARSVEVGAGERIDVAIILEDTGSEGSRAGPRGVGAAGTVGDGPDSGGEGGERGIGALTWIAAGTAVAMLTVGAVFAIEASAAQSDLDNPDLECDIAIDRCKEIRDDGDRAFLLRNVFLVGGGAVLGVAALLFYLDLSADSSEPSDVTAMTAVSPEGVAVRLGVVW